MTFRTSSTTQQRQNLMDLQATQERLALNQTRIASGKRVTQPGDDPVAAALILDFGTSIDSNTQYLKQVDSATSFLQSAEDAVGTTINDTTRLQELAQQGLSSTNAGSGRAAMAAEVGTIRANLLAMGNTQVQGKYLFAGTNTTTPAFDAAGAYQGNNGVINLAVSAGAAPVATNVTGRQVFQGGGADGSATDIFQVTSDLQAALTANDSVGIQQAATRLQTIQDNLNQVQADLGGRQAGLADSKSTLASFTTTLQGLQSTQQDTDYAQAITQYSSDQTIQSATLSAMAKNNKTSLFDYLA